MELFCLIPALVIFGNDSNGMMISWWSAMCSNKEVNGLYAFLQVYSNMPSANIRNYNIMENSYEWNKAEKWQVSREFLGKSSFNENQFFFFSSKKSR